MTDVLESVSEDADGWSIVVNSENVVETMNRVLASKDGSLPQVTRKPGTVASWMLKPSSYAELCSYYGVTPKDKS